MAGALLHMMDISRHIFVVAVVADAMEMHFVVAARAHDAVAMRDAADALMERRAALRAAHANFQIVDGIVHEFPPGETCHTAVERRLTATAVGGSLSVFLRGS
jgi:hypothetical protein